MVERGLQRSLLVVGAILASGCTLVLGADKGYHEVDGTGGASGAPASSSRASSSTGGGTSATSSTSTSTSATTSSTSASSTSTNGTSASSSGGGDPNVCPGASGSVSKGAPLVIMGDTSGATDKFQAVGMGVGNCGLGPWPGPDLVYAVTPTASGQLTASLDASYADPFIRVRTQCPGMASDEIACEYAPMGTVTTMAAPVTAGTAYYVIADSWNNGSGPFTLTVTLQ